MGGCEAGITVIINKFVNECYWADAGQEIDLELVMTVDQPGQIEETILCDLKHSSAPVYVYVKATFEVSAPRIRTTKAARTKDMRHRFVCKCCLLGCRPLSYGGSLLLSSLKVKLCGERYCKTNKSTVLPCYIAQVHEPKRNTCEEDKKYITD